MLSSVPFSLLDMILLPVSALLRMNDTVLTRTSWGKVYLSVCLFISLFTFLFIYLGSFAELWVVLVLVFGSLFFYAVDPDRDILLFLFSGCLGTKGS